MTVRAILFDMGGTLDGDRHWLDRFATLYEAAGLPLPRAALRQAFDEAERRAAVDENIASARLAPMIETHVGWQLASLGIEDRGLHRRIVDMFVESVCAAAAENIPTLAQLSALGFRLGVVSNGCGNVDVLCEELGYLPHLSAVVDSRRVGLSKPDPAIFIYAASRLGVALPAILMVGDSIDRDVRPAKGLGMRTGWLEGPSPRSCTDPSIVDIRLRHLADLLPAFEAPARTVA